MHYTRAILLAGVTFLAFGGQGAVAQEAKSEAVDGQPQFLQLVFAGEQALDGRLIHFDDFRQ